MVDMFLAEQRSYVRADLSFRVKFRVMTSEEYEKIRETGEEISSPEDGIAGDITDREKTDTEIATNSFMTDFLLHMDEKLDKILAMLPKDGVDKELFDHGVGVDISGGGMKIAVDKPVDRGRIIHTHFVLSRFPLVFLDVFGEVVRVTPVDKDGKTIYNLGIKFLDLTLKDRESIIGCVFQKQRRAIRKRKSKSHVSTDS